MPDSLAHCRSWDERPREGEQEDEGESQESAAVFGAGATRVCCDGRLLAHSQRGEGCGSGLCAPDSGGVRG